MIVSKTQAGDLESLMAIESTASVPCISTAALLAHPKNAALRALVMEEPRDPLALANRKIAIISTDGVEELELLVPLRYLRGRGATVHVLAPKKPTYPDHLGILIPDIRATHVMTVRYMECRGWVGFDRTITEAVVEDYDAVFVPGGAWNPDALRADQDVLKFLRASHDAGKLIATICHGPWVVGDAGLLKGKRATGWWSIKKDIERAGAVYVDEPVIIDGNLISSRHPIDLAVFLAAVSDWLVAAKIIEKAPASAA
jgi:protease I